MAYVTGVGLIALVCVAMPLKYFADNPEPTTLIGQLHGFLFMIYAVLVLLLGYARGWRLVKILLVLVAGTIPFATFVAERRVVAAERELAAG
jgi:integral membrane protein